MKLAPWIPLVVGLVGCGRTHPALPASRFELRNVSAAEIAKLEAALPKDPKSPAPAEDLSARVRGLVLGRARLPGKLRAQTLDEVASIGAPAVPIIDALLDEKERDSGEMIAALEALGAIDTPSSTEALAERVDIERVRNPAIRAQAAFQLTKQSADHVLPRLLAQLKYESDGETVIWIAAALAKHKNYAGLDGLRVLAASSASPEARARAQGMLASCAAEAGFADGDSLVSAWWSSDSERRVPREEPSSRLRLETWRYIAALSEFDLKRVDDARFALSRSASWVVEPLIAALHEQEPHTRVHVAQCLERMGSRASAACAELALALDERQVAASAAAALGGIRCTGAVDTLAARTRPASDPELRTASAAALGKLGAPSAIAALVDLLAESEAVDLRQAAAQSLVALGHDQDAIGVLVDCLTNSGADASSAETVLEEWLGARTARDVKQAAETFERWRSLGAHGTETPTLGAVHERQRARANLLRESLPSAMSADR